MDEIAEQTSTATGTAGAGSSTAAAVTDTTPTPRPGPAAMAGFVAGGFAMGSADLVPGVSGGTVALVLGIYDRLVAAVRQGASALARLARLDLRGFWTHLLAVEWAFLLPLVGGVLTAVVVLAGPLTHLLETQAVVMSAIFAGLVLGSVVVAHDELERRDTEVYGIVAAVAVAAFVLLGLRSAAVSEPSLVVFAAAGAVAICAMILPGVSGSFILLMLGMYAPVLEAVEERQWAVLAVFLAGATLGLGAFSTVLHWALSNHRDRVLAALVGLMLGSLRVLWPWPAGDVETNVGETALGAPTTDVLPALVGFVVATAVVVIVGRLTGDNADDLDR